VKAGTVLNHEEGNRGEKDSQNQLKVERPVIKKPKFFAPNY
jgi:hypothetical protein